MILMEMCQLTTENLLLSEAFIGLLPGQNCSIIVRSGIASEMFLCHLQFCFTLKLFFDAMMLPPQVKGELEVKECL